jgi:hypothetical protein
VSFVLPMGPSSLFPSVNNVKKHRHLDQIINGDLQPILSETTA